MQPEGFPRMTVGRDIVFQIASSTQAIREIYGNRTPESTGNKGMLQRLEAQKSLRIIALLKSRQLHSGFLQGFGVTMAGEPLDLMDVEPYTQRYINFFAQLQGKDIFIFHSDLFQLARAARDPQQRSPEDMARLVGKVDEFVPETPVNACRRIYDEIKALTSDRRIATEQRLAGNPKAEKRVQRLNRMRAVRVINLLDLGKQNPDT